MLDSSEPDFLNRKKCCYNICNTDSLSNSLGEEMDESLLLLSLPFREPSINYFELKDDLQLFA